MSFDASIMAAAQQKFRRDREYREEQFLQRQTEIYRRLPRVEEIDRSVPSHPDAG